MDTKTMGERLRLARLRAGMTQEGLSYKSGISKSAIIKLEADRTDPNLRTLICLADTLGGLSIDWLIGRAGDATVKR